MWRLFFLMVILVCFAVVVMGIPALIHVATALFTVLVVHYLVFAYQKGKGVEPTYGSPSSPLVAGMIVGLSMPVEAPFWATAGVALLTMSVFKYVQGRYFDRKYLNPAASAKFLLLLGMSAITREFGMLFYPGHSAVNMRTAEGFQSAMEIFESTFGHLPVLGIDVSALEGLIFFQNHGWIGGASGIATLIVGAIAARWLRLKWRIIVSTLGTMTVLAVVTSLLLGSDPILRIGFHVFSGSVMFMAFFMATEPQSTPMPEISQYIFGAMLAVLTFVFQLYNFFGGSIFALIIMNVATPALDSIIVKKPYGHRE